ncbi:hypothetical protein CDD83_3264 [Cordyceps sp. RAO-2017]|nr:hypothetical protein CDD83_3264 [Cordyceps sp. RAO-2017]
MKSLSLGLAGLLLQEPLFALAAKVPVRAIGENAAVDGNRVSWTDKDGWEDGFGCPAARVLSVSADKKYGACCEEGNALRGSRETEFHCCADGHDVAGSLDVGFTCCPTGHAYDGTVCKQQCVDGKVLVDGRCGCPDGQVEGPDGTCKPHAESTCSSGLETGKCYMFKGETGRRLAFKNKQYSEAQPNKEVMPGKFQLCLDEKCTPKQPVKPSNEVYIKDIHGSPPEALDAGQWLNNAAGGAHIGKTADFTKAGKFSFTKWPCGKYCLGGFERGLGPACPAADPSMTFYTAATEACVEFELIEVPCKIRDDANSCLWRSGPDPCCGRVDCSARAGAPTQDPPFCPAQHGTTRTAADGAAFDVLCGRYYSTGGRKELKGVAGPEACQQLCAADGKCQGANWCFSKKYCSHHYEWKDQPKEGNIDWVTFRPSKER